MAMDQLCQRALAVNGDSETSLISAGSIALVARPPGMDPVARLASMSLQQAARRRR
jgi:hypothetical protein